ncbi:MAG TPA: SPOR domain-containing protein [Thermodesulfobacteriota bacterium]|nr:SPOR domain-containing protein [Thermodesulfobacteriota bacterium]
MTGDQVLRFIILFVPLLVYLILGHAATSFSDNAAKGVHIVELKAKAGIIKVFLPDDISAGDTVSASIALYPGGVTREVMDSNLGILSGYIIETSFFKVPAGQKSIKITVPRNAAGTDMKFTLRDASMKTIDSASVPISLSSSGRGIEGQPTPHDYQCPLVGQAGRIVEIKGPFDGDFATTDFKIGSKKANVIAESPRKLVFESPSDVIGSVEVVLVERNVEVRRPFTCLQVLKIGEGDAVPVVSASGTAPPRGQAASAERNELSSGTGITKRELPPATRSLEFRSIKAEENLPHAERTAQPQAPAPGRSGEEIRIILANQMESRVSLEGSINVAPVSAEADTRVVEQESTPPARTGEYLEETTIEIGPEKVAVEESPTLPAPGNGVENVQGVGPSGSTAAVLEGQLLASFTGGSTDEGLPDAANDPGVRSPAGPVPGGKFTVQVASYREKGDARELADRLTRKGYQAFVAEAELPGKGTWYRVRVGRFGTRKEAASFGENLKRKERSIKTVYVAEDD